VAITGLGVGTLAAYASVGEHWTFFEIDSAVLDIARDRNLFSYLADSRATIDYVLGDARLTLASAPDAAFGMLILDAFSSDGVPAHLLTHEAFVLYLRKLAPGGLLVFQLSNRFLDLEPVVAGAAVELKLAARARCDYATAAEAQAGKSSSCWLIIARTAADLAPLASDPRWKPARVSSPWTDDAWSLWPVFKPRGWRS
jgi:spermidine synthase